MKNVVLRLLEIKFKDLMLSYSSFRLTLDTILEDVDSNEEILHTLIKTLSEMVNISDEELYGIAGASDKDGHANVDNFLEDMTAPAYMIFCRYIGTDRADKIIKRVQEQVRANMH